MFHFVVFAVVFAVVVGLAVVFLPFLFVVVVVL